MNTPTEQLSERLAALATTLSAATFAADPQAAARLQQLQGNHLELQCTAPKTTWHLLISEQALEVRSGPSPAPQAIVKGTAFDLLTWLLPGQHGNVEIEGDTSLLLELVAVITQLQPDLALPLSRAFGAERASNWVGNAELGLKGFNTLIDGLGQTVQQKLGLVFMQQSEMESFLQEIDVLRLQVDRLAAKIDLQERIRTRVNT